MKIKKKIIKNYFIQQLLALFSVIYIKLVALTSSIIIKNIETPQYFWKNNRPFILAFWHSQLMMISYCWKSKNKINILASGHSDGRFGAIVGKYFKLNNIPTSSNEKSISLKPVFTLLKNSQYIGITPDGPRGPNQKVSNGIIKISKATQVPIIPIGFASSKYRTLNSWDSFLITNLFLRVLLYGGRQSQFQKIALTMKLKSIKTY